jgi:exosome complex RNA-binding protein Rrp42 (RNase PH superfamily)
VGIDQGKYVLADPDEEEESLATETVIVAVDLDRRLRYLYKSGNDLKREDIKRCVDLAGERAGYLSFITEESSNKTVY